MNDYKIFAVDFDGTLCQSKWPEIGEPIQPMIDYCIKLREQGHKLILWTCRTGEQIEQAVKWCNKRGLYFHAVN
jgi:hydroxymethylpyrimidine pyrophosphatase-like HAD family hydrolase